VEIRVIRGQVFIICHFSCINNRKDAYLPA
jgi:hypothetical protein